MPIQSLLPGEGFLAHRASDAELVHVVSADEVGPQPLGGAEAFQAVRAVIRVDPSMPTKMLT